MSRFHLRTRANLALSRRFQLVSAPSEHFLSPPYDSDAWTFTRASEAAYVDSREDWAFVDTGFVDDDSTSRFPVDPSTWTLLGTPVITDNGDGTFTVEDDDATAYEGVSRAGGQLPTTVGSRYRVTWRFKKTVDAPTVFPEVQNISSSDFAHWQINTQTGDAGIRAESGDLNATLASTDDGEFWKVTLEFTAQSTGATIRIYPSLASTYLGGSSVTNVGSITFAPVTFERMAAWLPDDTPRIFSDGSILIEGASTNLLTHSTPDASSWTPEAGATLKGPVPGTKEGPDGAYEVSGFRGTGITSRITAEATVADDTVVVASAYLEDVLGPKTARMQIIQKSGATAISSVPDIATPGTWGRYQLDSLDIGSGSTDPSLRFVNGASGGENEYFIGLAQLEEANFPSSPIRTNGSTASRAAEALTIAPEDGADALLDAIQENGGFQIDFTPTWGASDVTRNNPTLFTWGNGKLRVYRNATTGTTWRFQLVDSSVTAGTTHDVDFDAGDQMRLVARFGEGNVWNTTFYNLTQGTSASATQTAALPAKGETLYIGNYSSGDYIFRGVIGRFKSIPGASGASIVPAWDSDLLPFARASEASFVDPRDGWSYQGAESFVLKETLPEPSQFAAYSAPTRVAGVADPFGGTNAETWGDTSGTGASYFSDASLVTLQQARTRWTCYVKQDSDETRFPEFALTSAGGLSVNLQINTATGETAFRGNNANGVATTELQNGWFLVTLEYDHPSDTAVAFSVVPARATVLGGNSGAAQGEITWYTGTITQNQSWFADDTPRVFSDGAILIEEERTNLVRFSHDLGSWGQNGVVLHPGITAPDGSATAYGLEDNGANEYIQVADIETLATGDHTFSTFVKKDDASNIIEIQIASSVGTVDGGTLAIQIDPQTGNATVRLGSGTVSVVDEGGWWRLSSTFHVSLIGNIRALVFPSRTSTLGGVLESGLTGSNVFWGMQVEEGSFATSPIRTDGSTEARDTDTVQVPADSWGQAIASGRWEFDFIPLHDSDDYVPGGAKVFEIGYPSASDFVRLRWTGASWQLQLNNATGVHSTTITGFTKGSKYTVTVDQTTGEVLCPELGGIPAAAVGAGPWDTSQILQVRSTTAAVISRFRKA